VNTAGGELRRSLGSTRVLDDGIIFAKRNVFAKLKSWNTFLMPGQSEMMPGQIPGYAQGVDTPLMFTVIMHLSKFCSTSINIGRSEG